ncbi:MAG: DUF3604 domain-containing protein, partial [Thermoanaerobaculia bacterium]
MNRRIIEGIIVKIETKPCLLSATVVAAIALLIGPTLAFAQSIGEPGRDSGKPNPLKNVYFGEQHLHTQSSADAFAFGTRSTPEDAYRFGQGEPITLATGGRTVKKSTPYDWMAVTDHAVYLGVMPMLLDPNSPMQDTPIGKMMAAGQGDAAFQKLFDSVAVNVPVDYMLDPKIMKPAWQRQVDAANKHYKPGEFTTLIAFEWTSQPNYMNLHHNVFFRDNGPDRVFSSFDSEHREDLWTYQEYQRSLGHENFSIPHNSNVSNGGMFALHTSDGDPIDVNWAKRSARNSPAVEIIQTKGASETNPALSPSDEFADFEQGFKHRLGSNGLIAARDHSFVRNALIDGIGFKEMMGVNPWKYGIVAGADNHTATSNNEEFNFHGSHGDADKSAELRLQATSSPSGEAPIMFGTAGTTAVWAPENTRAEIFDGIKRKETYGTSGTLIRVRFFGAWDFPDDLVDKESFVGTAYDTGVPMGGDLPAKPDGAKAPTFAVWALKDPESGNLDRIQIIKGWYDQTGNARQQVYDVAWSDGRKMDKSGKLPPVGNSVNVADASYTNSIGDTVLSGVWTDPDFDPSRHTVYYARVIEIPTPRWSTYDAKKLGIAPPEGIPASIQERAWTSPIWYTPDLSLVKKADFYPGLLE